MNVIQRAVEGSIDGSLPAVESDTVLIASPSSHQRNRTHCGEKNDDELTVFVFIHIHRLKQPRKKHRFIDKKKAQVFSLVHRSQRDPLFHTDGASKMVLMPVSVPNQKKHKREMLENPSLLVSCVRVCISHGIVAQMLCFLVFYQLCCHSRPTSCSMTAAPWCTNRRGMWRTRGR